MPTEGLRTRIARLADAADRLKRGSRWPGVPFSLAFFSSGDRGVEPALVATLARSRATIVLRDYDAPDRARQARRIAAACRASGTGLLVAGDIALARLVRANGVHWPARFGPPPGKADLAGMTLTMPCHSADDLCRAAAAGCDAAFLSPAFQTRSHPDEEPLGAAGFATLAEAAKLPVLALGGVDEKSAPFLSGRNVVGFGAIDGFAPRRA